jgi:hypothetical protein
MLDSEAVLAEVMAAINKCLVADLVRLNFGDEFVGKVRLLPVPIVSHKTAQARALIDRLLQTEYAGLDLIPRLDVNAVMDSANLPKTTDGPVTPVVVNPPAEANPPANETVTNV